MATGNLGAIYFLNEYDVADRLGVSVGTVRRWRWNQRGPRFIKVGFAVRYSQKDLEAWLASRPSGGEQPQEVA